MTVKDLYDMWGELHEKTVVDIYTSYGVFAIDMVTGRVQELPDTTLVEEVEAAMIVKA